NASQGQRPSSASPSASEIDARMTMSPPITAAMVSITLLSAAFLASAFSSIFASAISALTRSEMLPDASATNSPTDLSSMRSPGSASDISLYSLVRARAHTHPSPEDDGRGRRGENARDQDRSRHSLEL